MSRQGALLKNTAILSFGTVVPKFVNLVTLPILTGCLSKAEYGTYDLVVSMVTLLLPVATLQLQAAAFRFLIEARGDKKQQSAIVTNILFVSTGLSLAVLVFLYFLLSGIDVVGRLLICGYYLFDILVATLRQVARGLSKNIVYSVSVIANSVAEGLAVVGFVMLLGFGLNGALIASLLGQVFSFALLGAGVRVFSLLDFSLLAPGLIKELVSYSWPLIPNSLSSWAISMSDRLVLTLMLGIESSALYAAAMKVPNMLGIFQSAFNLAWQENASLSNSDKDRDAYYTKTFDQVFSLLAGGLSLLIASSPLLFTLLIQGDYEESYIHMNILFLGAFASAIASFFGGIYIAHRRTREIGATTAAVAVVNLISEIALVPFIGIFAASLAYTFSFASLALYRARRLTAFQPINFKLRKIGVSCAVLILMVVVGVFREPVSVFLNIAIAVTFFSYLNKEIIFSIVKIVKVINAK